MRRRLSSPAVSGLLLLLATVVALLWASSPWGDSYEQLRALSIGPVSLHLQLSLAGWASDGVLAIFFFVVGLELKHEVAAGSLRDPRRALVPVLAAVGGMAVPAGVYLLVNALSAQGQASGWAVPSATDIAFALAVLAVVGRGLPPAARTFLLTLAVVDDLLAIVIIAVAYTGSIAVLPLIGSLLSVLVFAVLVRRLRHWWVLAPIGVVAWGLMHASGVHATIAGVLLGLVVPVGAYRGRRGPEDVWQSRGWTALDLARRWTTASQACAVPLFAFFAAGVHLDGAAFSGALLDPVALGVAAGLVVGKPLGIVGASWLLVRWTTARLDPQLRWWHLTATALLGGIGFTVALLIAELALGGPSPGLDHVRIAVLTGSAFMAVLGGCTILTVTRRS